MAPWEAVGRWAAGLLFGGARLGNSLFPQVLWPSPGLHPEGQMYSFSCLHLHLPSHSGASPASLCPLAGNPLCRQASSLEPPHSLCCGETGV